MRVLITGGGRGIGLGLCAAYAERGDEVIATCRKAPPELAKLGVSAIEGIELTDDDAVGGLADTLPGALDVLICNAGINEDAPTLQEIDTAALARTYDVNALGAVRVVLALLSKLNDGAKINLVSNGAVALNVNVPSIGNYGYRMSKAALTSFGFGIARDLRDRGIAVLLASPGPVNTDMLRGAAEQGRTTYNPDDAPSAHEVGRMLRDRLDEVKLEDSPVWQEDPQGTPVAL